MFICNFFSVLHQYPILYFVLFFKLASGKLRLPVGEILNFIFQSLNIILLKKGMFFFQFKLI